jgi:hypothetical protein
MNYLVKPEIIGIVGIIRTMSHNSERSLQLVLLFYFFRLVNTN